MEESKVSSKSTHHSHLNTRTHTSKNFKQIFLLSFDALNDRKASICSHYFNGYSRKCIDGSIEWNECRSSGTFLNKQLNNLAPNVILLWAKMVFVPDPQILRTIELKFQR